MHRNANDDELDAAIAAEQEELSAREERLKLMPVKEAIKDHGTNDDLNDNEVLALLSLCERDDVILRFVEYAHWEIARGDSRILLTRHLGGWHTALDGRERKVVGMGELASMLRRAMSMIGH